MSSSFLATCIDTETGGKREEGRGEGGGRRERGRTNREREKERGKGIREGIEKDSRPREASDSGSLPQHTQDWQCIPDIPHALQHKRHMQRPPPEHPMWQGTRLRCHLSTPCGRAQG